MNKQLLQSICYGFAHDFNNNIFKLKKPFVIKVTKDKQFMNSGYAEWTTKIFAGIGEPDITYHVITVSFNQHYSDLQELKSTIFHEFVHGWQFENGFDVEHDENFWSWEKLANNYGLSIRYPDDNYADYIK